MLWGIFNDSSLKVGGEFKFQTEDEEIDTLEAEIAKYKKMGFFQ